MISENGIPLRIAPSIDLAPIEASDVREASDVGFATSAQTGSTRQIIIYLINFVKYKFAALQRDPERYHLIGTRSGTRRRRMPAPMLQMSSCGAPAGEGAVSDAGWPTPDDHRFGTFVRLYTRLRFPPCLSAFYILLSAFPRAAPARMAISPAIPPAPMPLSMFTTARPGAQVWSMLVSAPTPPPPSP